jgi:hypothetical protein
MPKLLVTFFSVLLLVSAAIPAFAEEAAEGDVKDAKPSFEYYQIAPIIVPVITDKGLTRQVSMVVMIEIPSGKMEEIQKFKPRLLDAYIRDLYGAMGAGQVFMRAEMVDAEALRSRLMKVTERVVGNELAKDVLLQSVTQYAIKG